jgi:DNA mismatch repair ATPase MutS
VLSRLLRAAPELELAGAIARRLETEIFEAPRLASLRATFLVDPPASHRIGRLRMLASLAAARRNSVMTFVGPLLLWDLHVAWAAEDWRGESGRLIEGWLQTIGEIEAIASLAAFAWERPDTTVFPAFLTAEGPCFAAEGLHHPLLSIDRAVANDVRLDGRRSVLVVSGSNMSGKSTFLRTVGISAVLARAGGPVCARHAELSRLEIGASIRIQDSLQEGTSRFYAEISRISHVLKAAGGPVPVLFLIDEILQGTNSHDRLIGAEAVVRALVERGAIGLITTHDLALARLTDTLGSRAHNVHFQDELENGRIRFDYRLHEGVVQRSNALELMRSVGLDV